MLFMMEKLIKFKAITSSIRHKRILVHSFFIKKYSSSLLKGLNFKGGRNHSGQISVRHRKKYFKRLYRKIDFKRNFVNIPYFALQIEKDPNRNTLISLIKYQNGANSYIIIPKNFNLFKKFYNLSVTFNLNKTKINLGECFFLKKIPIGSLIHNIEFIPNQGAKLTRAAGSFGQLVEKDFLNNLGLILLKSGKKLLISLNCKASFGIVSNFLFDNQILGKAGYNRWKGFKSKVRGVAMNPIDHPHGGGEGKSSGGRCSVSKWGKLTKGFKTRKKKKLNDMRSKWKYFYCDFKLMKQIFKRKKKFIYSRKSTILPIFLNKNIFIHNGIIFKKIVINTQHFFHKFGEFSFSKKMAIHFKKNKKVR